MRNLLRIVMLILIAVAVYFAVTFLIGSNDTYLENVLETPVIDSGENSEKSEEKENSEEVTEVVSGELEENVLEASEVLGELENIEQEASGEAIEKTVIEGSEGDQEETVEELEEQSEEVEDK